MEENERPILYTKWQCERCYSLPGGVNEIIPMQNVENKRCVCGQRANWLVVLAVDMGGVKWINV